MKREHNCNKKPRGDIVILDGDYWSIRNAGMGIIDKILFCPWCGETLSEYKCETAPPFDEHYCVSCFHLNKQSCIAKG